MMKQVKRAHTLHARTTSRLSDGTTSTPRAAWRRNIKPVLFAASLTALLARLLAIAGFRDKPNGDWVARESVFVERRLLAPANHPEYMSPMSTVYAFRPPDEAAMKMRDPTRRAMLPHIPPEWNPGMSRTLPMSCMGSNLSYDITKFRFFVSSLSLNFQWSLSTSPWRHRRRVRAARSRRRSRRLPGRRRRQSLGASAWSEVPTSASRLRSLRTRPAPSSPIADHDRLARSARVPHRPRSVAKARVFAPETQSFFLGPDARDPSPLLHFSGRKHLRHPVNELQSN